MLDDTLVVWGGEFGRTPLNEERADPNFSAATITPTRLPSGWLAAASRRPNLR